MELSDDHLMSTRPSIHAKTHSDLSAKYEIGFEAPGDIVNKEPVHESIAIAAFINSNIHFQSGVKYDNLNQKQWEYIRGLIWNDDPSCLLLNDSHGNNHDFGVGIDWYRAFRYGPDNCMTKRSHFGNLQFLHAMAPKVGEPALTTKHNLMGWLEVMYKFACGGQGVASTDQLAEKFPNDFNASTVPNGSATLKELILATTPSYGWANLERRALGICLHIIQDSYAIGHTQRCLCNPEDLAPRDQQGYIQFKPNTFGRYGAIRAFHTYKGQNEERHSHYDRLSGGLPTPKDLDSFNNILGARDAIDGSTKLINLFDAKTKWVDGVLQFLSDEIFALDPKVQPANTEVDPSGFNNKVIYYQQARVDTREKHEGFSLNGDNDSEDETGDAYRIGLARKLNLFESGLAGIGTTTSNYPDGFHSLGHAHQRFSQRWLRSVLLNVVTLLSFVTAMVLIALLLTLPRVGNSEP